MANIVKSNEPQAVEFDPFRAMREMMRWDPFRALTPSFTAFEREWTPTFEVRENADSYLFRGDLPGIKESDLEVSLTGNRLQITGKREAEKETKDETVYLYERSYGSFTRSFTLPEGIDGEHAKSELKDGVLTIVVPKVPAMKPKKIQVQTGASEKH